MYIKCEYCGRFHNGSYGSGRFCSSTCAKAFSRKFITPEGKLNQINALKKINIKNNKNINTIPIEDNKPEPRNNTFKKELGDIGKLSVIKTFMNHGIDLYQPIGNNSPSCILADFGGKLQKIQIKSSTSTIKNVNGINFRTSRDSKDDDKSKNYNKNEADYFALYDYNKDDVYLYPNNTNDPKKSLTILYDKKKNDNSNSNYASDLNLSDKLEKIENYPMFFYDKDGNIIIY